ncbi:unnamed protein product [Caenorhabditis angaria]|uniref:Uncharacterized protein n=1 Tax=Caenorhabditis angaria TaxID=860376 RepID=A0A9P1INZ3_9PELO|nr:unnamed protein product [Caenorhabditis angaria]
MVDETTRSTKLSEMYTVGDFRALGAPPAFNGDEIIVLRSAETISEVFPDWVSRSGLTENNLIPFDVNCPVELPNRSEIRKSYSADPPLSEMGKITAKMMGREIIERKIIPTVIISTPDLASVETAAIIQKFIGLEKSPKIRIEPELSTMHNVKNVFFNRDEFLRMGINIDSKTNQLKAITSNSEFVDLVNHIKRAFHELTNKQDSNILMIVDALSAKIIASLFYGVEFAKNRDNLEEERLKAISNFPPLASFSTFRVPGSGNKMYDISPVTLRPLNYTGFSSNIELD